MLPRRPGNYQARLDVRFCVPGVEDATMVSKPVARDDADQMFTLSVRRHGLTLCVGPAHLEEDWGAGRRGGEMEAGGERLGRALRRIG